MDPRDLPLEMAIEVVYVDPHLIELAASVGAGHWRGRATAYTVPAKIERFAAALQRFVEGGPPASFQAGTDDGTQWIELRFYRIDGAGHIACHTRLASAENQRGNVSRLELTFGAEAAAVENFGRQLLRLAHESSGRASLPIEF